MNNILNIVSLNNKAKLIEICLYLRQKNKGLSLLIFKTGESIQKQTNSNNNKYYLYISKIRHSKFYQTPFLSKIFFTKFFTLN